MGIYVSDGTSFTPAGIVTPAAPVAVSTLFEPMSSDAYSGLTVAASGTALSFTTMAITYWDDEDAFNRQGQLWVQATGGDPTDGCKNLTTGMKVRANTGSPWIPCSSAITTRAIIENSDKFSLVYKIGAGGPTGDYNIHIRKAGSGEPLRRAQSLPLISTSGTTRRVNIICPETADWEIHAVASVYNIATSLPSQTFRFVGVEHESTATVTAAPDRPMGLFGGDSHWSPAGAGVSGSAVGNTFKSFGIIDRVEELTGIVAARVATPGASWATAPSVAGAAVDITYVSGEGPTDLSGGASCFGSITQRGYIAAVIAQDGDHIAFCSQGGSYNGVSYAGPYTADRVAAFAAWLHGVDPGLPFLCLGVEPHNNWMNLTGSAYNNPYTVHQAIKTSMAAAANRTLNPAADDGFIDPVFPTPWYYGTGDDNTAGTGTQPTYIGADGLHPNYTGCMYLGGKVVDALGAHQIPAARALAAAV